tara:strand:+ start:16149 stop:16868 length:720 start_codon:yes stop_codon:yes gene_type:complete
MNLLVKETGGRPIVVHGHGNHDLKPVFDAIRSRLSEIDPVAAGPSPDLTVITCNNGHPSLGLFEETADRLGVTVTVAGKGRSEWSNAVDKPLAIREVLETVDTEFTLYADSRDCLLLRDPVAALESFRSNYSSRQLVFGADIVNWPPVREFQRYEKGLAGPDAGRYRFLNGGCWLGRTAFCKTFFEHAMRIEPAQEAPDSEQGLLKAILPSYPEEVTLDYGTHLFFNCGFVAGDIIEIE